MKRILISAILLGSFLMTYAQKSISFKVEDLKKPDHVLQVNDYQTILYKLLYSDNSPSISIIAKSNQPDSLVNFGYHPFFEGMYHAYADHRPFTLSPDMIWLLICQGFDYHVNNNSDDLRDLLVNFKAKTSLVVQDNNINLNNPNSPWEEVFPQFSKQISSYTGNALTEAMTANFTTTTPITKMASQITLMDAVKSYFDFMVITIGCGIPQITLEGTTQDWENVFAKTEALRKYKLDWWVDKMEPVLKQFIEASKGKADTSFWQGMFKYHTKQGCGAPTTVDGWIVKFFPYDKFGKRNNLDSLSLKGTLPNEIVKVDLDYLYGNGNGDFVTTPLEIWAGFVGLKQDNSTFGLKPEIGWMIRKKDVGVNQTMTDKLKKQAASTDRYGGILITTKTVPPELLSIGPIHFLEIYFIGNVQIPDEMGKVKVDTFRIHGSITEKEEKRIRELMPGTNIIINN